MKKNASSNNERDVIVGKKTNKESIYYIALFGVALVVSIVLLFISISQKNTGLTIYSSILIPVFVVSTAVSARLAFIGKDKMYVEDRVLVIKKFFSTKKYPIDKIEKLKVTKNYEKDNTSVKITYKNETDKYIFKNFTKEDGAHLKSATFKH